MATSGSVDWTLTSRQVITEALEELGVVPIGETPSAEDGDKAMRALNRIFKSGGIKDRLFIKAEAAVTLIASTAALTATPVSLARRVEGVRRRTSNIDTPLMELSREEYFDLPSKTQSGFPTCFYFDPQRAARTLYVWPVPDATIAASTTLRMTYRRVLEDVDALDNDPDVPQEYLDALVSVLAAKLILPYRKHLTDPSGAAKIEERAALLTAQLDADSQEDASVFMGPA
jgi:hypothetical protein